MPMQIAPVTPHPRGEVLDLHAAPSFPLAVDTHGRRFHVEWDADAPVTPLGQLVFFSQFLATAGLFHDWVKACPLVFASNNAPALNDLLGTTTLLYGRLVHDVASSAPPEPQPKPARRRRKQVEEPPIRRQRGSPRQACKRQSA